MAESCSIYAHCINSEGQKVESILFKDALHFAPDRETAKEWYGIGINSKFLEQVDGQASFDENGEITFQSLRKLANLDVKEEGLLNTLNDDIESGLYPYEEAIAKLQSFNRNSQFADDFMATIKQEGNQYRLSVVKRNDANEAALEEEIENRSIMDRIKYYLNKAGVSVEFLDEGSKKYDGRYSTKNAQRAADGLYNLIQVSKGEKIKEALAEEAGHFAIGALGDSPLVSRLIGLLTPEVQKKILGNEYETKAMGSSYRRELAGDLVGQMLLRNNPQNTWELMASRIANLAKRVFNTISGNDVANAILDAKKTAQEIAKGFMSSNFTGTVENALNTKETLYSAEASFNVKTFKEVVATLKKQANEMRGVSESLYHKFNNIAKQIQLRNVSTPSAISDYIAFDGIVEAISLMSDLMESEIPSLLEEVNFSDTEDFNKNMARNAKNLRAVRIFARNALSLIKLVNDSTTGGASGNQLLVGDYIYETVDESGNKVTVDLGKTLDSFHHLLADREGLINALNTKEFQMFLRFMQEGYGKNYIERSARVLFDWKGKKTKGKLIEFRGAEKMNISDLLTYLEGDISIFERYMGSASNCEDVVVQISDKYSKTANKLADDRTEMVRRRLLVLRGKLKEIGLKDTSIFCERSIKTGKLTGNILSRYCWGDWEDEWIAFKKQCEKEFWEENPDLEGRSEGEIGIMWSMFFDKRRLLWHKGDALHKGHSKWDKETNRWIPNDSYLNKQWDNVMEDHPERIKWLESYMGLKTEIDSMLGETHTVAHRMPQFKGTFSNKIRNRKLFESGTKATIGTIRATLRDLFCEDSEDTEYGSAQTYNTLDEDMFSNRLEFEKEKLNRLPLYGINKLKNTEELSTDLFYSTFAYAGMANTYGAMSKLVDIFEIGKEVLLRRKVKGLTPESELGHHSLAYTRFVKFLDKQIYNVGVKGLKIGKKFLIAKTAMAASRLGSTYFLGGNVTGGIANVTQGFTEIIKEAIAGEYYSLSDFRQANAWYFQSIPENLWSAGEDLKTDKVSLLIRHFNILNENRAEQRNWHTNDSRITNLLGGSLFLPYKMGDHYMQTISYLALANRTKLYTIDGKEVKLFDAYKIVDITDEESEDSRKYGKELELSEMFFKTKEGPKEYKLIESILDKLETKEDLNDSEMEYINNKGYSITNISNLKANLINDQSNLVFSDTDESAYMDKAREINNRLHGIYNKQDAVAFSQTLIGKMLMSMRNYILGMAERRFGTQKYSLALQGETEGSYRTALKVFMTSFTDKGGFWKTAQLLFLPTTKRAKGLAMSMGFSENQYRNMRRFFADYLFIGLVWLVKALTALDTGGDDDDDDEETDPNVITGIIYYFASRLFREQTALATPRGVYDEFPNVTSMTPAGLSALGDIANTAYLIAGSIGADEENSEFFYQASKKGRYEKGDPKWQYRFFRMFPFYRSIYTFTNPYEAAAGYEFGRKVRN